MVIVQSQTHPLPQIESRLSRFYGPWIFPLFACFLLLALLSARLIDDSDLGFHLRSGQWILENHRFPSQDPFTYTVPDHAYTDMEWLYQVPLYLAYKIGGYTILSLLHIGLILAAFVLVIARLLRTGAPLWFSVLLFTAIILSAEFRFRTRPEILSWVLMGLTLWVLESWTNRNRLFLLPLIQWVWVNTEGLFFIGWGLIFFYCASFYFHSHKIDRKFFFCSVLALAATFLNPYFIKGLYFPFKHLAELNSSDLFKNYVQELKSPWGLNGLALSAQYISIITYMLSSFFLLFLVISTFKKRKVHEFLVILAFFGLSATALRNIPFFMLACAPIAASCWRDLDWNWKRKYPETLLAKPICAWVFTFLVFALCLRVVTSAYYVSSRRAERFGLGINQELQPIRAAQFLAQNQLTGRILNSLDPGDWLEWQGRQKTFIDGRLHVMGRDLFTEYISSLRPGGLSALVEKYQIKIIFLSLNDPPQWIFQLKEMPEWRLAYLDESDAVYLRKGYAEKVRALNYDRLLGERSISTSLSQEASSLIQKPSPSAFRCLLEDFYKPADYPNGLSTLGIFCARNDRPNVAEPLFLEAIRRTQGRYSDLFYNLGYLYYLNKRNDRALPCMERVLREQPGNLSAKNIVENLLRH